MRATAALQSYVGRSDDRRIERTLGSRAGLRVLFSAMCSRFAPERAQGFEGEIRYALRRAGGRAIAWTVRVDGDSARAAPGMGAAAPAVTVKLTVADFVRLAAGELDAGEALLAGRLDLEGDFAIAARLGEMFGRAGL